MSVHLESVINRARKTIEASVAVDSALCSVIAEIADNHGIDAIVSYVDDYSWSVKIAGVSHVYTLDDMKGFITGATTRGTDGKAVIDYREAVELLLASTFPFPVR